MQLTLATPTTGSITGLQSGTAMLLTTKNAAIQAGDFDLSGTYAQDPSGLWRASITFSTPGQVLVGSFAVVDTGQGERLFLVTTQTSLEVGLKRSPTPEMTSGEAVKISA